MSSMLPSMAPRGGRWVEVEGGDVIYAAIHGSVGWAVMIVGSA
jgi:hypothetical protein